MAIYKKVSGPDDVMTFLQRKIAMEGIVVLNYE